MGERKLLFLMNAEQAERFARLLGAAERGDGGAACRLGDMYREGKGGLRYSPRETYRWYSRSALAGDANGQNNLGACYEHGVGCAQSYVKAVKWYRLSAAQQLGTATMNLGYCYLQGQGVPVDKAEALRLFRLATDQGETRAQPEAEKLEIPAVRSKARVVPGAPPRGQVAIRRASVQDCISKEAREEGCKVTNKEPLDSTKEWTPEAREEAGFDIDRLSGKRPEEVDPRVAERYAAYLAKRGVTDEQLAQHRAYSDLALRAWEKDDCFDLPDPDSEYGKQLHAQGQRLLARKLDESDPLFAGKPKK